MLLCRHHAFQRTDCPLPSFLSVFSFALAFACLLQFENIIKFFSNNLKQALLFV